MKAVFYVELWEISHIEITIFGADSLRTIDPLL